MFRACSLTFAATLTCLAAAPSFLLPSDVVPKKHIVELTIDPALDLFSGWARIDVELSRATNIIWVNAKDLTPTESTVTWQGRALNAKALVEGAEFIGLELASAIGPGN